MASKNTSSNSRQAVQRSNSDSARWVAGLLLLFIGVFAASAVLFSFFTWAADQSGLLLSPEERATLGVEPGNLCGWAGARLGRLLVDNSFGVSGILIPVMVVLVGVRVIRTSTPPTARNIRSAPLPTRPTASAWNARPWGHFNSAGFASEPDFTSRYSEMSKKMRNFA